jgi:hypothetical protein
MNRTSTPIRFKAKLLRPAVPKTATWSFLILPTAASAKLPTRSMCSVEGEFAGQAFRATLAPDGQGSHWLKVPRALREAAGVEVGSVAAVDVVPTREQPEARVPTDLRKALVASPEAKAQWTKLTPIARRDWIQWIESSKQAATRARRIANGCDMLASGKRRVCCFDRSGIYSKALGAPLAAES